MLKFAMTVFAVLMTVSADASPRFYIAPIVGSGSHANPFRADLPPSVQSAAVVMPLNVDGSPKFAFAIVVACQADHTAMAADAEYDAFPVNLNNALTLNQRNALITRLNNRGWTNIADRVTAGVTWRQVLRFVGRWLQDGDEVNGSWIEDRLSCAD